MHIAFFRESLNLTDAAPWKIIETFSINSFLSSSERPKNIPSLILYRFRMYYIV